MRMRRGSNSRLKEGITEQPPITDTSYGRIRGKRLILTDGKEINVFLGIPFAKPPLDDLRFKKPEPPEIWTTILDTRRYKDRPIQTNFIWDQIETGVSVSEDCLYLNVVAPARSNDEFPNGYPILFYIHGGGYIMDSASKYNYRKLAKNLVSKDVIVVTVEYRLGCLGFLCLDENTGNYGVWDIVHALKFVKENARAFGGNPEMITVAGQSAGSCIADLLSISPVSRDLFQRSILMAGFAENSWAVTSKRLVIDFCRKKALSLGFKRLSEETEWTEGENAKCIEFLRRVPSREFGMSMIGDRTIINEMRLLLTPVIMNDELFPRPISQLREESAPKNSIVGITKHEGLLFLALGRRTANKEFLEFCENKIGTLLDGPSSSDGESMSTFRELYGINKQLGRDKKALQRVCVNIMTDFVNGIGLHKHCIIQSAQTSSHCYRYVFEQYNVSLTRALNLFLPFTGPTHGCELPYLFGVNIFVTPFLKTKADQRVSGVLTRLWTNFVKYGDPNDGSSPTEDNLGWKPVSRENPSRHLVIRDRFEFKEQPDPKYIDKLLPVLDSIYSQLSN